jgi:hypothetical protein
LAVFSIEKRRFSYVGLLFPELGALERFDSNHEILIQALYFKLVLIDRSLFNINSLKGGLQL